LARRHSIGGTEQSSKSLKPPLYKTISVSPKAFLTDSIAGINPQGDLQNTIRKNWQQISTNIQNKMPSDGNSVAVKVETPLSKLPPDSYINARVGDLNSELQTTVETIVKDIVTSLGKSMTDIGDQTVITDKLANIKLTNNPHKQHIQRVQNTVLPKFDGTKGTALAHLQNFESKMRNFSDEDQMVMFIDTLEGQPALWAKTYLRDNPNAIWIEFKREYKKEFDNPLISIQTQAEIEGLQQKQDESIIEFYRRVVEVMTRNGQRPTPKEIINKVVYKSSSRARPKLFELLCAGDINDLNTFKDAIRPIDARITAEIQTEVQRINNSRVVAPIYPSLENEAVDRQTPVPGKQVSQTNQTPLVDENNNVQNNFDTLTNDIKKSLAIYQAINNVMSPRGGYENRRPYQNSGGYQRRGGFQNLDQQTGFQRSRPFIQRGVNRFNPSSRGYNNNGYGGRGYTPNRGGMISRGRGDYSNPNGYQRPSYNNNINYENNPRPNNNYTNNQRGRFPNRSRGNFRGNYRGGRGAIQAPATGCFICGGPHFQKDCNKQENQAPNTWGPPTAPPQ